MEMFFLFCIVSQLTAVNHLATGVASQLPSSLSLTITLTDIHSDRCLQMQHLGRPRQEEDLHLRIQDVPGQHNETLIFL